MIQTERLLLRRWRESDKTPFAKMNADPRVMQYMAGCLSPDQSDALAARIEAHFIEHGFGLYAAELIENRQFIGFTGLSIPNFEAHFTPCVEIGWRLAAEHWGRGLATEGARGVAKYAFETLRIAEIVSFTVPANTPSRRVMEKLGMTHREEDDFEHPRLPEGHPLRRHVLYRLH